MVLTELLVGVRVTKLFSALYGKMVPTQDLSIRNIQYDSRKVGRGDIFVAVRGTQVDGHRFIEPAINNGAVAIVIENDGARPDSLLMHEGIAKIVVPDSRKALARMSANFYGHPSKRLRLVGVTGTNGKTTTSYLIKSVLEASGASVGLIGTIEYRIGDGSTPALHTTPESLDLNRLLAEMVREGCAAAVMEVSSHALVLNRVHAVEFAAGVFTNLTQDHLDFHGSMDEYFMAKKTLFDSLGETAYAIVNADDPLGRAIIQGSRAMKLTYGVQGKADVSAQDVSISITGTRFRALYGDSRQDIASSLTGRFNVANILAAYATGVALGVPQEQIKTGIKNLRSVRGRFEQIQAPAGWTAIIDYAHTPDALENCLQTIHAVLPRESSAKIITIFGCGGNRDRGKRPQMGRIATTLSDVTIVTSDNPRGEDPKEIIDDIVNGVEPGCIVHQEVDRRTAIRKGLRIARRGDIVLIAGKGHEDYQVVGDTRTHFDDREEVETYIHLVQ
jgi:UDP-N-acetylmuramoyl-L-alanyl-D-glutamate--2,6-diaminopimelate ligase